MKFEEVLLWLRRQLWWLAPLILLLINLLVLSTYRSIYSGRANSLASVIEKEDAQLRKLEAQGGEIALLVARVEAADAGIQQMYRENFSTEEERFTAVTKEWRDLARRAGVVPDRVSYPEELYQDYGIIKRSMTFGVTGTYRELRLFVNYLELSDSFLVLESLGLQDSDEGLRIRVTLSTLFSGRDQESASLRFGSASEEVTG